MHVHSTAKFSIPAKAGDTVGVFFFHFNYFVYCQFSVSRVCWFQYRRSKKWITRLGSSIHLALVRSCKQNGLWLIQATRDAFLGVMSGTQK